MAQPANQYPAGVAGKQPAPAKKGPTAGADDRVAEILRLADRVITGRGMWEQLWQESAQVVWPPHSLTFTTAGRDFTPGGGLQKTEHQFDATASNALVSFVAIMDSLNTPSATRWGRLVPSDPVLMRNRNARLWFEQATDLLFRYRYSAASGFQGQNQETWLSLGAFGNGQLFIDAPAAGEGRGLRYRAVPLGEVYYQTNHQGRIDGFFRVFRRNARQLAQKFGFDALPDEIAKQLGPGGDPTREFEIVHYVCPRQDVSRNRLDSKGLPFASYYVSRAGNAMLSESGYLSFPMAVNRYWVGPGEVYGRGPAILSLPDIKTLNDQERTLLKQGHRIVDPVLLVHDDGIMDSVSLRPGAVNFGGVTADGRPLVHPLPTGNPAIAREMMADKRAAIEKTFLLAMFQILTENPQMTATEVVERAREKGMLLAPTAARIQSEYLGPLISREVDVLAQQGLLPPMPQFLKDAQGEYEIVYDSPMSRLQKSEAAAGTMRTIQWASEIASVSGDPAVLDNFDWDVIIPDLAEANAMPEKYMASPELKAQRQKARAQAQQAQQMKDILPSVAGLAKAAQAKDLAQAATGNGQSG